ncbi:MAG: AMP-binding protein [Deltaproteobacteria bacterium]|nr:AMP-binding protein [Deltaproteobacteria bacterium]
MFDNVIRPVIADPNLSDYAGTCRSFSWQDADRHFTWQATGKINIAHEAIDRHAADPHRSEKVCLICPQASGSTVYTYSRMRNLSNRFANVLKKLGIGTSDRVCLFLPGIPEFYIAMAGCAKAGAIIVPLYSDYMAGAVKSRMQDARPKAIVTDADHIGRIPLDELPDLEHVIIAGDDQGCARFRSWNREMDAASPCFEPVWLEPVDPFLIIYTSGPDGSPVGLVHVHEAMKGYLMTARWVLDIRDDDVVFTLGRPGWFMSIVYSAFAPWLCGVASVVCDVPDTAGELYQAIEHSGATVLYTTPSVYSLMTDAGPDYARNFNCSRLRHLLSVLEPLSPEMIFAVMALLKLLVHDTWWSAETGMITIANMACLPIKPGYLGKPCPGLVTAVLDEHGNDAPYFEMGRLALRPPWPAMARGIWGQGSRALHDPDSRSWFMTGDVAFIDHEGYYFYQGRADDAVITSAGKINISEIEQALRRHPAAADAAVVRAAAPGEPKRIRAFVVPAPGFKPVAELERAIIDHVGRMLSPDIALASIHWCSVLPRHSDGRINTLALKASLLGLTD